MRDTLIINESFNACSFFSNFSAILETLTFVSENDTSKSGAYAHSLLLNVTIFQFFPILTLEEFRSDENFTNFWTEAYKAMTDHDLQEPTLGRSHRPLRRMAEGSLCGDVFSDAKQSY